jgi:hypothetical protein
MHSFRLKHIALASTLALAALGTSPALAQLSGNPTAAAIVADATNPANNRVLFISGASAVFAGFHQIATSTLQPGFFRFAPRVGERADTDYVAFAGQLRTPAGGWAAGTNVIIINRALGGSVWGVNPVARAEEIESLDISATSCTTGAGTATDPFRCGVTQGTTANPHRVPDAGISDLAPALFVGDINNEGEVPAAPLSVAELARLTATPVYTLGFGVPVSNNVPDLKLTRAALAGIMAGAIANWGQVDPALATSHPAVAAADMLVCRRVPGSGTQAIANLYFGNHPCTRTTNVPATRDDSAAPAGAWDSMTRTFTVEGNTGAANIVELSTSGDVRACLTNAALASSRALVDDGTERPATLSFDAAGRPVVTAGVGYTHFLTADRDGRSALVQFRNGRTHAAVGLLSLDSLDRSPRGPVGSATASTPPTGWSFRSLDGAGHMTWDGNVATPPVARGTGRHSTLANLVDGTWDKVGVISYNVPTRTTGNMLALANQVRDAARNPAILHAQTRLRFGATAIAGTPDPTTTGQVQRVAFVGGNQCAPLNLQP